MKRFLAAIAFAVAASTVLVAQNPVSISQVGTTPVGTTVPVSGTITANAGANLNTSALALDATVSTLDTDVKANIVLAAGTHVIGHVVVDSTTIGDGSDVTLGAKADAKSTATDTTAITAISILKEISFMEQNPASQAVTGTFWQATQPVSGTFWQATQPVSIADGSDATLGAKADAKSTATDTTSISVMSVLKQISASVQAPPSQAVTNAGTFATQATLQAGSALAGEFAPVTTATTTDAASTCYVTSAASTNSTNCKASAGNIYGVYVINTTTTNYFLRIYNASSAPTCSSATGFIETIPALGAAANGGGISRMQVAQAFSTGIGFCLTGGGSSTDNTNAATGVYLTILYK